MASLPNLTSPLSSDQIDRRPYMKIVTPSPSLTPLFTGSRTPHGAVQSHSWQRISSKTPSRIRRRRAVCVHSASFSANHGTAKADNSQNSEHVKSLLGNLAVAVRKLCVAAAFAYVANKCLHGQGTNTLALLGIQLIIPVIVFKKVLRMSGLEALGASLAALPVFWASAAKFIPPQKLAKMSFNFQGDVTLPAALVNAARTPNFAGQAVGFLNGSFPRTGLPRWIYIFTWVAISMFAYTSLRLKTWNPAKWGKASADACRSHKSDLSTKQRQSEKGEGKKPKPTPEPHVVAFDTNDWALSTQEFQEDTDDGPQLLLKRPCQFLLQQPQGSNSGPPASIASPQSDSNVAEAAGQEESSGSAWKDFLHAMQHKQESLQSLKEALEKSLGKKMGKALAVIHHKREQEDKLREQKAEEIESTQQAMQAEISALKQALDEKARDSHDSLLSMQADIAWLMRTLSGNESSRFKTVEDLEKKFAELQSKFDDLEGGVSWDIDEIEDTLENVALLRSKHEELKKRLASIEENVSKEQLESATTFKESKDDAADLQRQLDELTSTVDSLKADFQRESSQPRFSASWEHRVKGVEAQIKDVEDKVKSASEALNKRLDDQVGRLDDDHDICNEKFSRNTVYTLLEDMEYRMDDVEDAAFAKSADLEEKYKAILKELQEKASSQKSQLNILTDSQRGEEKKVSDLAKKAQALLTPESKSLKDALERSEMPEVVVDESQIVDDDGKNDVNKLEASLNDSLDELMIKADRLRNSGQYTFSSDLSSKLTDNSKPVSTADSQLGSGSAKTDADKGQTNTHADGPTKTPAETSPGSITKDSASTREDRLTDLLGRLSLSRSFTLADDLDSAANKRVGESLLDHTGTPKKVQRIRVEDLNANQPEQKSAFDVSPPIPPRPSAVPVTSSDEAIPVKIVTTYDSTQTDKLPEDSAMQTTSSSETEDKPVGPPTQKDIRTHDITAHFTSPGTKDLTKKEESTGSETARKEPKESTKVDKPDDIDPQFYRAWPNFGAAKQSGNDVKQRKLSESKPSSFLKSDPSKFAGYPEAYVKKVEAAKQSGNIKPQSSESKISSPTSPRPELVNSPGIAAAKAGEQKKSDHTDKQPKSQEETIKGPKKSAAVDGEIPIVFANDDADSEQTGQSGRVGRASSIAGVQGVGFSQKPEAAKTPSQSASSRTSTFQSRGASEVPIFFADGKTVDNIFSNSKEADTSRRVQDAIKRAKANVAASYQSVEIPVHFFEAFSTGESANKAAKGNPEKPVADPKAKSPVVKNESSTEVPGKLVQSPSKGKDGSKNPAKQDTAVEGKPDTTASSSMEGNESGYDGESDDVDYRSWTS